MKWNNILIILENIGMMSTLKVILFHPIDEHTELINSLFIFQTLYGRICFHKNVPHFQHSCNAAFITVKAFCM